MNREIYFTNYLSLGLDAHILCQYQNFFKKFTLLPLRYFKKFLFFFFGLSSLMIYRPRIDFQYPSKAPSQKVLGLIFHNIRRYAGGSILTAPSLMNDECLELTLLKKRISLIKLILNRFAFFSFKLPTFTLPTPIHFEVDHALPIQIDGEQYQEFFKNTRSFTLRYEKKITLLI